jgi:hypothetical protein
MISGRHTQPTVIYTVCSRGRVLGTTDLGFIYRENGFRCGWLEPTDLGERLLPRATGVSPALRVEYLIGPDATAQADILSAIDQEEALELELRYDDGRVVETESIAIVDTEYLLSLPLSDPDEDEDVELTEEQEAEIAEMLEEFRDDSFAAPAPASSSECMRYQVQIQLIDHKAIL